MISTLSGNELEHELRVRASRAISLFSVFLMLPFAINNFYQGRTILGVASLAIALAISVNTWVNRRSTYRPLLSFSLLVPVIIVFLGFAVHRQGVIGVFWSYPAVLSFYIMLPERKAWAANVILLLLILPMSVFAVDWELIPRVAATLIGVSIFAAVFVRIITSQQTQLITLACTDSLTGVLNRTSLSDTLSDVVSRFNTHSIPVTLLSIDLDHFKRINDEHGHDTGDRVLVAVGELLRGEVRKTDFVFRMGGEEFLIVMVGADKVAGVRMGEQLKSIIAETPLLLGEKVTASVGVAELQKEESVTTWRKRVDDRMYDAKRGGRNRVEV